MPEKAGEVNAYWCPECRGYIVTVLVDDGTTPSGLACRVLGEPGDESNTCVGRMTSLWYPARPWPERDGYGNAIPRPEAPTHEWYAPVGAELKRLRKQARRGRAGSTLEHVEKGGLLLRVAR